MKHISGISNIIATYDALLLDLWGVIHDGTHLYPGVRETLVKLRASGKKIIFISNAPRRAGKAASVLDHLGVESGWYDHIITSGEMGYQWLAKGECGWGRRYYYIGPPKDLDILTGLDYRRVDDIKEADFLLNVGFGSDEQSSQDWSMLLRSASRLNLPMLCLNPDLEVVKISGERFPCAGVLAQDYIRHGGKVTFFGKPHGFIYAQCMEWLTPLTKNRILAVGDGIGTDIAGAVAFGIDSALVTGGILHKASESLEVQCAKHNANPTYVMSAFNW